MMKTFTDALEAVAYLQTQQFPIHISVESDAFNSSFTCDSFSTAERFFRFGKKPEHVKITIRPDENTSLVVA